MTDRELLELAARAAGMNLGRYADGWNWSNDGPRGAGVYKIDPNQSSVGNPRFRFLFWNPLVNDGDALRLAVKLRFVVAVRGHEIEIFSDDDGDCLESIPIPPDGSRCPLEMTRRAIVEAAAEIGKTRSD